MRNLLFIFLSLVVACSPQKRIAKIGFKHPDALAELCADQFPPIDSAVAVTKSRIDTFWTATETLEYHDTVPCPPDLAEELPVPVSGKVSTKSKPIPISIICKDSIIYRTNNAKTEAQTAEIDQLKSKLSKSEAKVNSGWKRTMWFSIIAIIIGFIAGFMIAHALSYRR